MYTGNAFISQYFEIPFIHKIIFSVLLWIFAIIMLHKYAPADTEDVPVISKNERQKRKYISYAIVTVMLIIGCVIKSNIISNIILVGVLIQTISITRIAYKITNNKYGHEEYLKDENLIVN